MTEQYLHLTTTYHLSPKRTRTSRLPENMTKDPLSEFFFNKKNPDICSGVAGYISSEEIFSFFQQ